MLSELSEDPQDKTRYRSGSFTDNMKLPVHRWFRYSAGFSAEWAENVIRSVSNGSEIRILDPFCGSGTTLLSAAKAGVSSVGFEAHPFVARIASIKLKTDVDLQELETTADLILRRAKQLHPPQPVTSSDLLLKCYTPEALSALEALRMAYVDAESANILGAASGHIWLAITSILRECSGVGTAQWQYVLPNKTKARTREPYEAFEARIRMFLDDLCYAKDHLTAAGKVLRTDARNPDCSGGFDLVLTSPPYPNNYDYADATRLEMTFWEEISRWGDLQCAVRQYLIRSCSQHSAAEKLSLDALLADNTVAPIREELTAVCRKLDEVRQTKGGRKTYHTMVAAYFVDLAKVMTSLRGLVRPGGRLALMIGDSAPYGVYAPVDKWLGDLAISSGFHSFDFEKVRDRNTKWKNRKHTVPLKEGILWVEA
ncbi:MAG: hypothetical protein KDJ98_16855 [Rhodobacteraceae bacterium]|nr:hypothetical protein [Paracoccaceae bacterium]